MICTKSPAFQPTTSKTATGIRHPVELPQAVKSGITHLHVYTTYSQQIAEVLCGAIQFQSGRGGTVDIGCGSKPVVGTVYDELALANATGPKRSPVGLMNFSGGV